MHREHPRAAIVGTGNIARVHARAFAAVAGQTGQTGQAAPLIAAMDAGGRQLKSFGTEFGVRGAHRDLAGLLSHGRPGLVLVCTPPSSHGEPARLPAPG